MDLLLPLLLTLIITTAFLVREVLAQRERKDLLDRIMAKDFIEFKTTTEEEPEEPEKEDTVVPIEDAQALLDDQNEGEYGQD